MSFDVFPLKHEKENKLWNFFHWEFTKSAKNEKCVVINHFTIWTRLTSITKRIKKKRNQWSEIWRKYRERDLQFSQRGSWRWRLRLSALCCFSWRRRWSFCDFVDDFIDDILCDRFTLRFLCWDLSCWGFSDNITITFRNGEFFSAELLYWNINRRLWRIRTNTCVYHIPIQKWYESEKWRNVWIIKNWNWVTIRVLCLVSLVSFVSRGTACFVPFNASNLWKTACSICVNVPLAAFRLFWFLVTK